MANIRAVVVRPDGDVQEVEIEHSLESFQTIVGGWIEAVSGREATVYVDEEGLLKGALPNPVATWFAVGFLGTGAPLYGTALIVGPCDSEGNDTPVRPSVVDYLKEN